MAEQEIQSDVIWADVSITKQIVQYEPIKLNAGARMNVKDITDQSGWDKLWATLEAQLDAQIKDLFPED